MMKYIKVLSAALIMMIVSTGTSYAIIITATPNPVEAGQEVEITVISTYGARPNCDIFINFGDGSGRIPLGNCSVSPCTLTTTHTYEEPGNFTISARSIIGTCIDPPDSPDPARTAIRVMEPPPLPPTILKPVNLPPGVVGIAYEHQLSIPGGRKPLKYTRLSGALPPGLKLSRNGLVSGIPAREGTFRFTAQTEDQDGLFTQQEFAIRITRAAFSVKMSPQSFNISRNRSVTKSISYSFTSKTQITATLRSTKGEFFAGGGKSGALNARISSTGAGAKLLQAAGQEIGAVNKPLIVQMTNGRANATETITLSAALSKQAERLGASNIIYRRTFTSDVMPSATATMTISFAKPGAAQLRVTRIQIYFENKRPKITVKRNQKDLKAYADIRYDGTGLLQGQWEVDGRILQRVQKHLIYGRSITLETPVVPPLPTFSPGTHEVKFIVTQPAPDVEYLRYAKALYFVTAEDVVKRPVITLTVPENQSEMPFAPVIFKWTAPAHIATYLIEFMWESEKKPFFAAYTKSGEYHLPVPVLNTVFSPQTKCFWRVRGFDKEDRLIGFSPERNFTFQTATAFVPGQILLITPATPEGMDTIENIGQKYGLRLLKVDDIKSLDLKMAIFQTDGVVLDTIKAIQEETDGVRVQPNYIFKTLSDPLSRMQNIHRIFNLEKLHTQYLGKDIRVAVVDTGVDIDHQDLKDGILAYENFIDDSDYTAEIHGTAVAGVIGAAINGFGIEGVAPEAGLIACRACRQVSEQDPEGECYTTSIVMALDMAIQKDAQVVNMSFGAAVADSLLLKLIEEGAQRGIIFVAPVGNRPDQEDLVFPAAHPDVLAVAGTDENNDPFPSAQIAAKAAVSAPATNVFTTIPGDKHNFLSGTSLASAVVTGLLAVAYGKNGGVQFENLPVYGGDHCQWGESLLKIALCGN